jgi:hypothetical protein
MYCGNGEHEAKGLQARERIDGSEAGDHSEPDANSGWRKVFF